MNRHTRLINLLILILIPFVSMGFKHKQPIKGWSYYGSKSNTYKVGIDSINGRTAAYIISKKAKRGAWGILMMRTFKADKYLGKRIRLSADIKTLDVKGWARLGMATVGDSSDIFTYRSDYMKDRRIKGTTDWKRYEIVLNVPKDGITIAISLRIDSTGEALIANMKLEEVDTTVSCSERKFTQKNWDVYQIGKKDYVTGIDSAVKWNNAPSYYCKAAGPNVKNWGGFSKYLYPKAYLDKKIKITAYIKTSNIRKSTYFNTYVSYYDKYSAEISHNVHTKLKPNQDWTKYETVIYIPCNSEGLQYFINMHNRGEVWISNVNIEVVGDDTPTTDKKEKKYPKQADLADGPTLTFTSY